MDSKESEKDEEIRKLKERIRKLEYEIDGPTGYKAVINFMRESKK